MSVTSAKSFLEKVQADEVFKNKLAALEDGQARINFANESGFSFTPEELTEAKAEIGLSDEELDAVAGGCGGAKLCLKGLGDAALSLW